MDSRRITCVLLMCCIDILYVLLVELQACGDNVL